MTFDPCKFCGSEALDVRVSAPICRPLWYVLWHPRRWLSLWRTGPREHSAFVKWVKFYCVNCLSCGAQGPFVGCDSEEDARDAWNRSGWISEGGRDD